MSDWSPGIQKVLDHVARTNGWRLSFETLRRSRPDGSEWCPLESFDPKHRRYAKSWRQMERDLKLGGYDAHAVVTAADVNVHTPLRAALLKAAKLT